MAAPLTSAALVGTASAAAATPPARTTRRTRSRFTRRACYKVSPSDSGIGRRDQLLDQRAHGVGGRRRSVGDGHQELGQVLAVGRPRRQASQPHLGAGRQRRPATPAPRVGACPPGRTELMAISLIRRAIALARSRASASSPWPAAGSGP